MGGHCKELLAAPDQQDFFFANHSQQAFTVWEAGKSDATLQVRFFGTHVSRPNRVLAILLAVRRFSCIGTSWYGCRLKRFADEFFTFLPEGLGIGRVERVGADAFAEVWVVGDKLGDVAIFAVLAADLIRGGDYPSPH